MGVIVNDITSFHALQKYYGADTGEGYVDAYCGSGIDGDTPVYIRPAESGFMATALAASTNGYVGVSDEGSVTSGSWARFQIEGYRAGIQCSAAAVSGTAGEALTWTGATLFATASSYIGAAGQIGVITETLSASTTANVYLTGMWTTAI